MSDLYSELLVKKERTAKDRLVKGGIIALIVLLYSQDCLSCPRF